MTTHRIEVTKPGHELEAVCHTHAANFPGDKSKAVARFSIYRAALEAGWRRLQRKFICPDCAKKEGVS